ELHNALLVNMKQPDTLVSALEKALSMHKIDVAGRFNAMNEQISTNTIHSWSKDFMGTLRKPIPLPVLPLYAASERRMVSEYGRAKHRALFLDYDGVLRNIIDDPDAAKPSQSLLDLLESLNSDSRTDVYVLSGRSRDDLSSFLGDVGVGLVAEHGAFIREPGSRSWGASRAANAHWKAAIRPILERYADQTTGAHLESKATSLVWHYREAAPFAAQKNLVLMRKELKPILQTFGLRAHTGKKILEVKHKDTSKGQAVKRYLSRKPYDFILVAGDDYTDETMFKAAPAWAYTIRVGGGVTSARFRVKSVGSFLGVLRHLRG
ncbi:MAG: trehalose-phosphatase, partial [Candidatus Saccharimonadales bacterium]